jgi:hypothetical protein
MSAVAMARVPFIFQLPAIRGLMVPTMSFDPRT